MLSGRVAHPTIVTANVLKKILRNIRLPFLKLVAMVLLRFMPCMPSRQGSQRMGIGRGDSGNAAAVH